MIEIPPGADLFESLVNTLKDRLIAVMDSKIFPIIGALLVVILIWGGIRYIISGSAGAENAKKIIIAAIVGAIIIVASKVILDIVIGWINYVII